MTHTTQTPTTAQMLAEVAAGLKAWRDELQAATPGPWQYDDYGAYLRAAEVTNGCLAVLHHDGWLNGPHICTMANREPSLLAYLEGKYEWCKANLLSPSDLVLHQTRTVNGIADAAYSTNLLTLHDRALAELTELHALCGATTKEN